MKMVLRVAIATALVAVLLMPTGPTQLDAREAPETVSTAPPERTIEFRSSISLDRRIPDRPLFVATPNETTVLGEWTFDVGGNCDPQGWTGFDWTAPIDEFFHVDDFAGLGGGDFGRLIPIEGNQSLWCGQRADAASPLFCGYGALPGYGNSWEQGFVTASCLSPAGDLIIDYLIAWHSEPNYDYTTLQYDRCDDNWIDVEGGLGLWDDTGSGFYSNSIPDSLITDSVRVRFWFVSDGAWSDQDGLWDSDGAVILDSLTLSDASGVLLPTELFETESPGDKTTASGNWTSNTIPGYGDFSGLFHGTEVVQEDPCVSNLSCLWAFFKGSTYDYSCGGFPAQAAVPYENARGQYLTNAIWSPWIPLTGTGMGLEFHYDVYRDLPLSPLISYRAHTRALVDGCPDGWSGGSVRFGPDKDWFRRVRWIDPNKALKPGTTAIQVAVEAIDRCDFWCGTIGTGECHTHAPLFDNMRVIRINYIGPQWSVRDIDLFQDNFASDGTTTGTVRVDEAIDILPSANPNIRPGDSTTVRVNNPQVGLADDTYTGFGPAVYMYAAVWPQNQPGKSGDAFTSDSFRWPVVDSLSHNGDTWYCLRMDTSFTNGVARTGPQPDAFCIDLNDNLFTPGDTICFVFSATSGAPEGITSYYTRFTGGTENLAFALNNPMEMTCLPSGGADILYVDDYNDLGAQPFFDTAFEVLGISDRIDRYDVRGPNSTIGNGPGARVVNVSQQLLPFYGTIIWNSGDLKDGLIGDGTTNIDKSDDAALLLAFLDGLTSTGGIYFSGDNIAEEWPSYSGSAIPLRDTYIQHTLVDGDHIAFGQPLSPFVLGESGGCLDGDTLVAYGGCLAINDFDVLSASGPSTIEASYGAAGSGAGAIVAQQTINPENMPVGVVLSGFSFHEIRDVEASGIPARAVHLRKILTWLGNPIPSPTNARPSPYSNSLAQNYPNPFNPTTTVEFTMKTRANVTLRVYNVAGQLVITLLDETRASGIVHRIEWNGANAAGQQVASGVYFYRLVTKGFTKTRKMVLLK